MLRLNILVVELAKLIIDLAFLADKPTINDQNGHQVITPRISLAHIANMKLQPSW